LTLFTFAPAPPPLTVSRATNNTLRIAWSWPSSGSNLQQSTNLSLPGWSTPPETVQNDGTNNFINVTAPAGNRFFRLLLQ
jgi:hypothetical protein